MKRISLFFVNIPPAGLLQKTDYCGMVSGHSTDKSGVFTPFYDVIGKAPMISECSMNILCKAIQTIPMFDFDFFLGEIAAVYINEECLTDGRPEPLKIDPLILMGGSYCSLGLVAGSVFEEGHKIKNQ